MAYKTLRYKHPRWGRQTYRTTGDDTPYQIEVVEGRGLENVATTRGVSSATTVNRYTTITATELNSYHSAHRWVPHFAASGIAGT